MPALQGRLPPPIARHWPTVAAELRLRRCPPERTPGESEEGFENRLGTGLMSVFRDTRDPAAFEALHSFAGPGLLRWVRALLGPEVPPLDPSEVLQDTFVNIYRYPSSFREEHGGSFRVWARTIAGNVVRRAIQRRSREQAQDVAADLVDPRGDPTRRVAEADENARLKRAWILLLHYYAQAWSELGHRDRRTLHLVEVEGLSYQEAGRILDVGRSNMKMIVFRSRRRLARRMRSAMAGAPALPAALRA
jgi:RNA polymerase sigma-70 factor (ECF subfamily)